LHCAKTPRAKGQKSLGVLPILPGARQKLPNREKFHKQFFRFFSFKLSMDSNAPHNARFYFVHPLKNPATSTFMPLRTAPALGKMDY
jgi:hypothetical protein